MDSATKIRWALTVVVGIAVAMFTANLLRGDADEPPPATEQPPPAADRSRTVTLDGKTPRGPSLSRPAKATGPAPGGDTAVEEEAPGEDAGEPEEGEPGSPEFVAYLLDAPDSITAEARQQPVMAEIGPEDVRYDSLVEAAQIFAPFEDTLMETDPLTPEAWKAALETHRERNGGVMKRADFLRRSGHPDQGGEMMVEWSRLYGVYQAKAYGR